MTSTPKGLLCQALPQAGGSLLTYLFLTVILEGKHSYQPFVKKQTPKDSAAGQFTQSLSEDPALPSSPRPRRLH